MSINNTFDLISKPTLQLKILILNETVLYYSKINIVNIRIIL